MDGDHSVGTPSRARPLCRDARPSDQGADTGCGRADAGARRKDAAGLSSVERVVVLAQQPESLLTGRLGWMATAPRISVATVTDGISASIMAIAGSGAAPYPVLVTTADHVLLRPEIVESFIAGVGDADGAFAVVRRDVVERTYPETQRTWFKFADGQYSGANLFALLNANSMRATAFWSRVEKHRKQAITLLAFFGPTLLLRILTRTIALPRAAAIVGSKLDLRLRPVVLEHPEAAIDVDKPEDLRLVERILVDRQRSRSGADGTNAATSTPVTNSGL